MLAFPTARLALLSVPKTGTTALEQALNIDAAVRLSGPPALKHLNLRQFQTLVAPILRISHPQPFETIALMREPVSWLKSWYRYRARPEQNGRPNSTADVSFNAFVEAYLSNDRPSFARLGRQSNFLQPAPGQPPVDHLFRYEAIDEAALFMAARLGRSIVLERVNVSPDRDATLSLANLTRLQTELSADFTLWESARVQAAP
ncbi:MAG: gamma-glutamyl kinase [Paracoccus denitrificans]|nr:MAG: gamma-glutamyl kinase [Paracoccus denitrificans]PZO84206.1 MAG: gamma-glutamyl kinase [Paracoccus denitrificans]